MQDAPSHVAPRKCAEEGTFTSAPPSLQEATHASFSDGWMLLLFPRLLRSGLDLNLLRAEPSGSPTQLPRTMGLSGAPLFKPHSNAALGPRSEPIMRAIFVLMLCASVAAQAEVTRLAVKM